MKKFSALGLAAVLVTTMFLTGCASTTQNQEQEENPVTETIEATETPEETTETASDFQLGRNVEFYVSSSSGGNSDIFARTIADIAGKKEFANQPIMINNLVDGQGQIARRNVSSSNNPNESLLCLSSGDLTVMITVGGLSLSDFRPIAIMGSDKHLIFTSVDGEYTSMEEVIKAAKAGEKIVVGGTSGDELTVFNMLMEELGMKDQFSYVVYGSSSESITALLGGHVQLAMGKPAAAKEYVVSESIAPVVALSTSRFAEPFNEAPTLSELGYNDVEFPLYRGFVGSANMSDEALAYWSNVAEEVSKTDEWNEYLNNSLLAPGFLNQEEATAAYEKVEVEALAALEK